MLVASRRLRVSLCRASLVPRHHKGVAERRCPYHCSVGEPTEFEAFIQSQRARGNTWASQEACETFARSLWLRANSHHDFIPGNWVDKSLLVVPTPDASECFTYTRITKDRFGEFFNQAPFRVFAKAGTPIWFIRRYVIPMYMEREHGKMSGCLVDHLHGSPSQDLNMGPKVLCSYNGPQKMSHFLQAIECARIPKDSTLWFDSLCIDQFHQDQVFKDRDFMDVLQRIVRDSDIVLLVLDDGGLRRAFQTEAKAHWKVLEVATALFEGVEVQFSLVQTARKELRSCLEPPSNKSAAYLVDNLFSEFKLLQGKNAGSEEYDAAMLIKNYIDSKGGFDKLNGLFQAAVEKDFTDYIHSLQLNGETIVVDQPDGTVLRQQLPHGGTVHFYHVKGLDREAQFQLEQNNLAKCEELMDEVRYFYDQIGFKNEYDNLVVDLRQNRVDCRRNELDWALEGIHEVIANCKKYLGQWHGLTLLAHTIKAQMHTRVNERKFAKFHLEHVACALAHTSVSLSPTWRFLLNQQLSLAHEEFIMHTNLRVNEQTWHR